MKAKSLKWWKDKAWKLISEYVRRKDADWRGYVNCYTCGTKIHWKEAQAGHFQHGKLDFDEANLKPQCVRCNHFKSGKLDSYTLHLVDDYGRDWVDDLIKRANKKGNYYTITELKPIIKDLEEKLNELK